MNRFLFNDARVNRFVAESVGSTDCEAHSSLGWEVDGRVDAGVVFDNYSGRNIFVHFSRRPGHNFNRKFLRLVFSYAFECVGVQRITGAFSSGNALVRAFAAKLGFLYETRLEGACMDGDMEFWRLERNRCRFLINWPTSVGAKAPRAREVVHG